MRLNTDDLWPWAEHLSNGQRHAPEVLFAAMVSLMGGRSVDASLCEMNGTGTGTEWSAVWLTSDLLILGAAMSSTEGWSMETLEKAVGPDVRARAVPLRRIAAVGVVDVEEDWSFYHHEGFVKYEIELASGEIVPIPFVAGQRHEGKARAADEFVQQLLARVIEA